VGEAEELRRSEVFSVLGLCLSLLLCLFPLFTVPSAVSLCNEGATAAHFAHHSTDTGAASTDCAVLRLARSFSASFDATGAPAPMRCPRRQIERSEVRLYMDLHPGCQ
jgi:hypothetical protein